MPKVFVEIDPAVALEDCLPRLSEAGLTVDRTIRNKIVGSIASDRLARLKRDPAVLDVEVSVPLKPLSD